MFATPVGNCGLRKEGGIAFKKKKKRFFCSDRRASPDSDQGLFLALHVGITPENQPYGNHMDCRRSNLGQLHVKQMPLRNCYLQESQS